MARLSRDCSPRRPTGQNAAAERAAGTTDTAPDQLVCFVASCWAHCNGLLEKMQLGN